MSANLLSNFARKIAFGLIFLLPVTFITIALFVTSKSGNHDAPKYDFVYTVDNYNTRNEYIFENDKIIARSYIQGSCTNYNDSTPKVMLDSSVSTNVASTEISSSVSTSSGLAQSNPAYYSSPNQSSDCKDYPDLYYHSVNSNSSRKISFDEASKYKFINSQTSPDGYTFQPYYYSGGIISMFSNYATSNKQNVLIKNGAVIAQSLINNHTAISFKAWVNK